ncbi:MAG: transglutaminase family protein, partial [Saprospiraceae bacterium]|nr:transglutaminase family protein [Saprospiraceae bacterium]
MIYNIKHITEYKYRFPATLCHNLICQGPGNFPDQEVIDYHCIIDPDPHIRTQRIDFFDNPIVYFSIEETHDHLVVQSDSTIRVFEPNWASLDPASTTPWEDVASWLLTTEAKNDTRQFYLESPHVSFHREIYDFAQISFSPRRPILEASLDLCSRIFQEFAFTPGFTEISTPLESVFQHRKGVCQDFAHLALSCLRSLGLAARYMSGYIETIPPPGKPKLVGVDASHAWIAVYVPNSGWVELDATNNK